MALTEVKIEVDASKVLAAIESSKAKVDIVALRTELARYAHDQSWAGWMKYMFSKMIPEAVGRWILPKSYADRWERQMNTPFDELPEAERKSDYDEADKILKIVSDCLNKHADTWQSLAGK